MATEERFTRLIAGGLSSFEAAIGWVKNRRDAEFRWMTDVQIVIEDHDGVWSVVMSGNKAVQ